MSTNYAIQYTIVGIIILAALIWIAVKANRARRQKTLSNGPCASCSLSKACNKKEETPKRSKSCCH
ncbi:MAG: hypothetical protein HDS73_08645 [Bacteroidales bacterium]|nr:hypothetical protein [Bacteroidales bacterium]